MQLYKEDKKYSIQNLPENNEKQKTLIIAKKRNYNIPGFITIDIDCSIDTIIKEIENEIGKFDLKLKI